MREAAGEFEHFVASEFGTFGNSSRKGVGSRHVHAAQDEGFRNHAPLGVGEALGRKQGYDALLECRSDRRNLPL